MFPALKRQRRKYCDLNHDRGILQVLLKSSNASVSILFWLKFLQHYFVRNFRKKLSLAISHIFAISCPFDFIIIFVFEHIHVSLIFKKMYTIYNVTSDQSTFRYLNVY